MEKVEKKLQRELLFERKDSELSPEKKRAVKPEIKRELKSLAVKIHSLKQEAVLDTQSGPIVANLEQMLLRNNIVIQAYHSRSFVGNHCAKYLKESVYTAVTDSVELKTNALTKNQNIIIEAESTAFKFRRLNELFSHVHSLVSHTRSHTEDNIAQIEKAIDAYVTFMRKEFPDKFPPKLHILECHLIKWMKKFPFGMGLLGEQEGESCHRKFNRLNRVMQAIPDSLRRLTAIMKEHVLSTHPKIIRHTILPKKRKLRSSQQ